jgi:hypothetical protein
MPPQGRFVWLGRCTKTVPDGNVFMPWGLASNGRQIPQVVGNIDNAQDGMELLESVFMRPRQARYQAALRPDW